MSRMTHRLRMERQQRLKEDREMQRKEVERLEKKLIACLASKDIYERIYERIWGAANMERVLKEERARLAEMDRRVGIEVQP